MLWALVKIKKKNLKCSKTVEYIDTPSLSFLF